MDANDIKETLAWYRIAAENALRELDKPIVIIPNVIVHMIVTNSYMCAL